MMYFILLIQQLIASGTHLIAKDITNSVEPPVVVFFRTAISVAGYSLWFSMRRKDLKRIERKDYWRIVLLGALNVPINQFLFLTGIQSSTAPNGALLYALSPAFVLIIALLFFGEQRGWKKIAGVIIAISGCVLVLTERGISLDDQYFVGNLIILAASFSWAMYTVVGKPMVVKYGAFYVTALSLTVGMLLYLPIFFSLGHVPEPQHLTSTNWLHLGYLGLVTSGLGFGLWYYALTKMEASRVAVFNNLQPILTTILAFMFFGTSPTTLFLIGGSIALFGVVLTQQRKAKKV